MGKVWNDNVIEEIMKGTLRQDIVEELFTRIRKEFGEFNKKSRKVNELRLLKQRSKTYNEYIQIFRKTTRGGE